MAVPVAEPVPVSYESAQLQQADKRGSNRTGDLIEQYGGSSIQRPGSPRGGLSDCAVLFRVFAQDFCTVVLWLGFTVACDGIVVFLQQMPFLCRVVCRSKLSFFYLLVRHKKASDFVSFLLFS